MPVQDIFSVKQTRNLVSYTGQLHYNPLQTSLQYKITHISYMLETVTSSTDFFIVLSLVATKQSDTFKGGDQAKVIENTKGLSDVQSPYMRCVLA